MIRRQFLLFGLLIAAVGLLTADGFAAEGVQAQFEIAEALLKGITEKLNQMSPQDPQYEATIRRLDKVREHRSQLARYIPGTPEFAAEQKSAAGDRSQGPSAAQQENMERDFREAWSATFRDREYGSFRLFGDNDLERVARVARANPQRTVGQIPLYEVVERIQRQQRAPFSSHERLQIAGILRMAGQNGLRRDDRLGTVPTIAEKTFIQMMAQGIPDRTARDMWLNAYLSRVSAPQIQTDYHYLRPLITTFVRDVAAMAKGNDAVAQTLHNLDVAFSPPAGPADYTKLREMIKKLALKYPSSAGQCRALFSSPRPNQARVLSNPSGGRGGWIGRLLQLK